MRSIINSCVAITPLLYIFLSAVAVGGDIHDAIDAGDSVRVRELLAGDSSLLNQRDNLEKTALHHAIEGGRIDIAKFLIAENADINLLDKDKSTPLHAAAALGNPEIARLLIDRGAESINQRDYRDCTPLYIASMRGNPEVVKLLIEHGADVDARDALGRTPLIAAGRSGNMEVVETLAENGADINATLSHGSNVYTVLSLAAMYGANDLADYLIERNADIHESTLASTLRSAVASNMTGLYQYIIDRGVSVEDMIEHDPDLIFTAAAGGSVQIMESLLAHGFDGDRVDEDGWRPLHYAASSGQMEVSEYLLERVSDKNARNIKGETAYHVAVAAEETETAEALERGGVDSSPPQFPVLAGPYMGQTPPGDTPSMFLPGIVSGHYRAHSSIACSPDGKEAYWTEMSPPEGRIQGTKLVDGEWTYPVSAFDGRDPSFSPDGKRLFFIRVRPFREGERPAGETDGWECYWYMEKTDTGWSAPVEVGDIVNAVGVHWPCSIDRNGNIYFSEFADNMYFSEYRDGAYQQPIRLEELFDNGTLVGRSPFISPDGDYLLFSTDEGVCVSFKRDDGSWTDRVNLGDQINATGENGCPRVTPDGKYIFFVSAGQGRPWGIYWVSASIIDRLRKEYLGDS